MDFKQYFEVHTNDCGNPTFISNYNTNEIIYLNQAMEKKFQIFEDYTGKTCEEVVPYFADICGYNEKTDVKMGQFLDRTFLCDMLNANLRSKATLLEVCGQKFLQTKYFLAPTNDKRQEAANLFEKAIAACLEILTDTSFSSPIDAFLELLGKFYSAELTYICEFDREKNVLSNSYLWAADGEKGKLPYNDSISMDQFIEWLEHDHYKSVINLDKSEHNFENYSLEEDLLRGYSINNITISKLWNKDGSLMGIVGLSNRAELMYDDRLLQAISHFVMEQFNQKSMVEALENLNDIDLLTGFYNRSKYASK